MRLLCQHTVPECQKEKTQTGSAQCHPCRSPCAVRLQLQPHHYERAWPLGSRSGHREQPNHSSSPSLHGSILTGESRLHLVIYTCASITPRLFRSSAPSSPALVLPSPTPSSPVRAVENAVLASVLSSPASSSLARPSSE